MSGLRIALFISLGVNLFVAGWWVGDIWVRPPRMAMPAPDSSFLASMVKERVSPETMAAIGPSLETIDATFRAGFEARNVIFVELRAAVSAEPYDTATVSRLLSSLVSTRTEIETAQWDQVGETLGRLSASERDVLAEIFFPLPSDRQFPPFMPQGPNPGGPPPRP